jgi:ankyrin repeat protein
VTCPPPPSPATRDDELQADFVRSAASGDAAQIARLLPSSEPSWRAEALSEAATRGHLECVKLMAPESGRLEFKNFHPLALAALHGRVDCVAELLLARFPKPPTECPKMPIIDLAMSFAAGNGHLGCLLLLAGSPGLSPAHFLPALTSAAAGGHLDCLLALLPLTDPSLNHFAALSHAAEKGHPACLRVLLPLSGSAAGVANALRHAVRNGHQACVEPLLFAADLETTNSESERLASLARKRGHFAIASWIDARLAAQTDSARLSEAIARPEEPGRPFRSGRHL